MSRRQQILLLEDVQDLGRSGDIVSVRGGYARNCLLPQRLAVFADKQTLKMQERLQKERAKKAAVDKKDAEALAKQVEGMTLIAEVKVDPEGHMYGSISPLELVKLFFAENVTVEKKNILLKEPIKKLGAYALELKLKEGVQAFYHLKVIAEGKGALENKEEETSSEETTKEKTSLAKEAEESK